MKASKKEFIAEAEDLLFESQQLLLELRETYKTDFNPDNVNALFRSIHTIKGLSGLFGHKGLAEFSHSFESLLDEIRLGKIEITDEVIQFLFKNLDILRSVVDLFRDDQEHDVSEYIKQIELFQTSKKGKVLIHGIEGMIDESITKVLSEYEEVRLKANIKGGKGIYLLKAVFDLATFDTSLEKITKMIKTKGELISTLPTSAEVPEGSIGFNLLFASGTQLDELKEEMKYDIEVLVPLKQEELQPQRPQESSLKSITTTVRVDIDKLDRILNTIGELTLAKGALKRIGLEMANTYGHSTLILDIHKISQTLERRLSELQGQVLEIRMVPVGQIFSRLSQVTRRYSKDTGKEIDLEVYGEDTELDKHLAEEIVDPLMHLVRNSIDHGIEPVEERISKGKKEHGHIVLKALQKGSHIVIEVRDDGKGIDIERIRQKAIEKRLIEPDVELTESELIDFIFIPGFSTKEMVSEISGRGVGIDVVKEKISLLGGFIEVHTKKDKGTTFKLTLPSTVTIIKALIVRVGKERFAVPLTSISETFAITHKDIQTIEWKEVYYLRGEMLPMLSVGKLLDLETDRKDRSFAVVVGFGERRLGLLVDELLGQQEIVIKSLSDYLRGLSSFSGAAEIGRHEVILALDVESFIESVTKQKVAPHV